MELSQFDVIRDAIPVQLRDPRDLTELLWDKPKDTADDPKTWKPVNMILYGRDSKPFKNRQRAVTDRRLQEAENTRTKGKAKVTGEAVEIENRRTLLACIAGWENLEVDGAKPEINEANAAMLLDRFPWIEEQVDSAIVDRANFIKPSLTTS